MVDNIKIILLGFNTLLLLYILFKDYNFTPIKDFKHKLWVNKMKKQGKEWYL